mmetsp:Transcript_21326/g.53713  ORF Transcript_21326/g.53713 Transcript_21326/m.53713 type:complete len:321 (-) Transcript_21326:472-1434(-)|eukprot:g6847.t1
MSNPSQTLLPNTTGANDYQSTGNGKDRNKDRSGPKSRLLGLSLMIGVPWTFFFVTGLLYTFVYHWHPAITTLFMFLFFFSGGLFVMVDYRSRGGGRWYMKLGLLSLTAVLLGIISSLYTYHYYFSNYWSYKENSEYINVLPSEPATAHSDAGKILFTVDTRVAVDKTLGYRAKDMYCVAPIMDYATHEIQYWATGLNCCQPRGGFACDDVWNPRARSAVVVFNRGSDSLFPSQHEVFRKAAAQACAEWGLTQATDPLFVRWVTDATKEQDLYYSTGLGYFVTYAALFAVWSMLSGAIMQMSSRKATSTADTKNVRLPPAL